MHSLCESNMISLRYWHLNFSYLQFLLIGCNIIFNLINLFYNLVETFRNLLLFSFILFLFGFELIISIDNPLIVLTYLRLYLGSLICTELLVINLLLHHLIFLLQRSFFHLQLLCLIIDFLNLTYQKAVLLVYLYHILTLSL